MATIQIGSITINLPQTCGRIKEAVPLAVKDQMAKLPKVVTSTVREAHMEMTGKIPKAPVINAYSSRRLEEYEKAHRDVFEAFFQQPLIIKKLEKQQFGKIKKKNSRAYIQPASEAHVKRVQEECAHLNALEVAFQKGYYEDVHELNCVHDERPNNNPNVSMATPNSQFYKAQKKRKVNKKIPTVPTSEILHIERAVLKIAAKRCLKVEFIGKRTRQLSVQFKKLSGGHIPCVDLPHMHGRKPRRELHPRKYQSSILKLSEAASFNPNFKESMIKKGYSGAIIPQRYMRSVHCQMNTFIVRGSYEGKLIDARSLQSKYTLHRIMHYSSIEKEFWKGWKTKFDKLVSKDEHHICKIDISNEKCGELVACIYQLLHPSYRISCPMCRERYSDLTKEEYNEVIQQQLEKNKVEFDESRAEFKNLNNIISNLTHEKLIPQSYSDNVEMSKLLNGKKATQLQQIEIINQVLIKGGKSTTHDFEKASKQLLEITRWFNKHLTLVANGDLETFRNKATSKAMLNPSLLCDNQLDKNGNFIWGERGYHSKRFFTNYFEEVTPGDGYRKYITRKCFNGTRKLAIGQLIVPLNLERARNVMNGEAIEKHPLTEACISRLDNSFVHVCCCVTTDDGKPIYSQLKSPTKRHLVVGTTGDPKYVDLPTSVNDKMYIATEGFCYLNIFLAMLINVNESEAKDFTKMVRDTIIPMLGKWPTMMDVATACYILTIFHPETRNAELPRILVDHTNQTFHVIDSFGSLNTGYHVLKAGTVNQLISFASSDLQSEMKWYRVGGEHAEQQERMEKALLRGIFRPKLLVDMIENDPYILFMSLSSPSLIKKLYEVHGFEKAMQFWIKKEHNICIIFSILNELARKVNQVEVLTRQIELIEEHAYKIHELCSEMDSATPSFITAKEMLVSISSRHLLNADLRDNGFAHYNQTLLEVKEKIFLEQLDNAFAELSWLERYYLIMDSRKCIRAGIRNSQAIKTEGSKLPFKSLCKQLRTTMKSKLNGTKRYVGEKIKATKSYLFKKFCGGLVRVIHRCYSDMIYAINMLVAISTLLLIIKTLHTYVCEVRQSRAALQYYEMCKQDKRIEGLYLLWVSKNGVKPTIDEFIDFVNENDPSLNERLQNSTSQQLVTEQAKTKHEIGLEKIVAFFALIAMIFDTERSDAVFRSLSKIKTVFGTLEGEVRYQSLDDIEDLDSDKKLVIDFELDTDETIQAITMDTTFNTWWSNQLSQNRVVPHYRSNGKFLEFTRENAAFLCNDIKSSEETEFLIRGAVGSGKSTALPYNLARKGKVLLLEPTRPLAENVCRQLGKEPFHQNATLRMRGLSTFGSSNIHIMTTGFALHLLANNPSQLRDFQYIIFDECHVVDSQAMAFYCLLKEYEFTGKVLKVSATPPGKECEFKTQFDVKLKIEDAISFVGFTHEQGTGSNVDVTGDGDNILVYVASYNDVDQLSKLLTDKGFLVTKVDGRTMKMNKVEIVTRGTPHKKHFVVATNIIENGVTLDIDVVVDFGTKVVADIDNDNRCMRYSKMSVSFGERIQRLGRVGRVKPGTALRIGHTEKEPMEIPVATATEAAFLCFSYGLPVMTHNVSTSILSKCTVKQAKVMMSFELPPFYMVDLIRFDGTMHPEVHRVLKPFKLRDSEVQLCNEAIPNSCLGRWLTVGDYNKLGCSIQAEPSFKVPFACRTIPDKVHSQLWNIIETHKGEAGFGRLTSACAGKVAYTLRTDAHAIPRTIAIIDQLIAEEVQKKAHFDSLNANITSQSFSLASIVGRIKKRYLRDHTGKNIEILQRARAQLLAFNSATHDLDDVECLLGYNFLKTVQYQSRREICSALNLEGKWNESLMARDTIVAVITFAGGLCMSWEYLMSSRKEQVVYQGAKRKNQKLKFRDARDKKIGREVYADDGTIEQHFGEAYTKRGKVKGNSKTKGMGVKTRRFIHMYGFDPAEYSFVRFVDPVTGHAIDESVTTDLSIVQHDLGEIRKQAIDDDEDLHDFVKANPGIHAYFIKDKSLKALKVDLTPHHPLLMCNKTNTIAGFPEREFELRQTGKAIEVDRASVPDLPDESVQEEGKSLMRGLRNYNGISKNICKLVNSSDNHKQILFGLGYGPIIITNSHLFTRNNGTLTITSHHGTFEIKNTTTIKVFHIKNKDMIVMRMPKDFPPFPMRMQFRAPISEEKCCLVGSTFQLKTITSSISETTTVMPLKDSGFWQHWVSTQDGDCGLPLVATRDGSIVGVHGLKSNNVSRNYFIPFADDFMTEVLDKLDVLEWVQHWKHSPDLIAWGGLVLANSTPEPYFRTAKLITDIIGGQHDVVSAQSFESDWIYEGLEMNLKAVAKSTSQLVTKHTVRGQCPLFQEYLMNHQEAREFFEPLMGAYGPSKLNKEAFKKDFFKYKNPINIGSVQFEPFQQAVISVIKLMEKLGFEKCNYITDTDEIFDSLNLKSAVGAMYVGKKREYLEAFDSTGRDLLLQKSCQRLYEGKMGIWNGSIKAELRPIEKLELNKTRTFTAAPIDTLLGGKVCVDDFNNQFYGLNITAPWTVGMSKFYGGWDKLFKSLPDGYLYCHADGSQFDSSLTPFLINAVVQIREHFMEDWEIGRNMLRNFYTEIVYTPILAPDGTIVKKHKGNNSGQPSTVVDNTLMVVLSIYYALKTYEWSDDEIEDRFIFFANGDDLIIAINPMFEFILDDLQEIFSELGLKYEFNDRSFSREDLWFMSHQGILQDGMYIPKLEQERIVSILEWDRSAEIAHRAEAICASMIEAWGFPSLLLEIRKFYKWVIEKEEYKDLAREGKFPYIAETALRNLYTNHEAELSELEAYWNEMLKEDEIEQIIVDYQASTEAKDAGEEEEKERRRKEKEKDKAIVTTSGEKDVDTGSTGGKVPRLRKISPRMRLPTIKGKAVVDITHLIDYKPEQIDLSNARATHTQFSKWYDAVKSEYDLADERMGVVMNGLMVWCIENGTSPNVNGVWVMMEEDEQFEFPLKPVVENAKPTLRQIMHHFSDAAEAYIEMRNSETPYMPRYGLQRNLRDMSLARFAFDFYEMTSKTPARAREAHMQMKAAALSNTSTKMFGLDGNVATQDEDTERHVATDVSARMHSLMGVRNI